MKKILLSSSLTITTLFIIAQQKIGVVNGTIISNDGNPIESATILLLRSKDSSMVKTAVSDKSGKFQLSKLSTGNYLISITAVGYVNFKSSSFKIDSNNSAISLPSISLSPNAKNLAGVTVVTQRPFIEKKIDKLVINVGSSPLNAGASAFDVLEKSPGVTIDENDNISLAGKSGVMIFIDGKPSYLAGKDLTNFLRGLPASQLDQLEIMTQPPARFDAAGDAGIINFRTKKNQANGFNGTITSAAIFSYHFRTRNSIVINWKKNKFNLSANYSYASLKNYVNQHIERNFRKNSLSNFNSYLSQDARWILSQYPNNLKISVDYTFSKKTTVGVVFNGTFSNNHQSTPGTINIFDSLHNLIQYTNYLTNSKNPVSNPAINFNLQHKFSKGKELTTDADYVYYHNPSSQSSYNYPFDKNNNPLDPAFFQNSVPLNINIYSLKSDYSQPLTGNAKLEAGIKLSEVKTDDNVYYSTYNKQQSLWLPDSGRINHFIYEENINAAYIDISKEFNKKWNMQIGLRFEQTTAKGNELVKGTHFTRNYSNLFPTLLMNYIPNDKNNFTLGYVRRINRPNYQFLNPFQLVVDQFTFQQGNPYLKPSITDDIEASYDLKNQLDITLNYTVTNQMFSPLFQTVKQGNNFVTIQMPMNVASRRNMGIDISYHKSITKWWNINNDLHLLNNHFKGVLDSSKVSSGITICFITLSNQFPLKKGWTLDLSGFYRTKRLEGFPVYAIPGGTFSFGLSKKIQTRATISISMNDPLRLLKGGVMSDRETFSFRTSNRNENRYLTLNINYRFGKAFQQTKRNSGGVQDEQSRL